MLVWSLLLIGSFAAAAPSATKSPSLSLNTSAIRSSDVPSRSGPMSDSLLQLTGSRTILDKCQKYLPEWYPNVSETCSTRDQDDTRCWLMGVDNYAMSKCKHDEACAHNRLLMELISFQSSMQKCFDMIESGSWGSGAAGTLQPSSSAGLKSSHPTVDLTTQLVNKNTSVSRDVAEEGQPQPQPLSMQTCLGGCNMRDTECQVPCLDPQFVHLIRQAASAVRRPTEQENPAPPPQHNSALTAVATLMTGPPMSTESAMSIVLKPWEAADANDNGAKQSSAGAIELPLALTTLAAIFSLLTFWL